MKQIFDEIKKENRNTTYKSLIAFVNLLYTDDKEKFIEFYKKASHDSNGGKCWHYMYKHRAYMNEYQKRKRIEKKG